MGLNNPSSGVNPWPNGNSSVALGDKSTAAGNHNIAGGTQLIESDPYPGDGSAPLTSPDENNQQTITIPGNRTDRVQVGDRILCFSAVDQGQRSMPVVGVALVSGDTEITIDASSGYLYYNAVRSVIVPHFTSGGFSSVGNGTTNAAVGSGGVFSGGQNTASGASSFIGGGVKNWSSGDKSNISGGQLNIASGEVSNVAGGTSNVASGLESNVAGGLSNIASGQSSNIAGGRQNTASGESSNIAGGMENTASGQASNVSGGEANEARGDLSCVPGGAGAIARLDFSSVRAAGGLSTNGDAQDIEGPILREITSDATPTELVAGSSSRLILENNSVWTFSLLIVARRTDSPAYAGYKVEGVIHRGANAAATVLDASTKTVLFESDAAYDVTVSADTTNGSLKVEATGKTGHTIRWVCTSRIAEVLA